MFHVKQALQLIAFMFCALLSMLSDSTWELLFKALGW